MKILLQTDGGARGNPGPAGYGYVVTDITQTDLSPGSSQGVTSLPTDVPQDRAGLPTETPQNRAGLPTETPQNRAGLPAETPQDRAGLPTEASAKAGIILRKCGNYCGETTNNQAEYHGLISGLTWINQNLRSVSSLFIVMDSLLIVNQIKGLYKVKNPGLLKRYLEVQSLLKLFPKWQISHTLRSGNSSADELVNQAIDQRAEVVVQ